MKNKTAILRYKVIITRNKVAIVRYSHSYEK